MNTGSVSRAQVQGSVVMYETHTAQSFTGSASSVAVTAAAFPTLIICRAGNLFDRLWSPSVAHLQAYRIAHRNTIATYRGTDGLSQQCAESCTNVFKTVTAGAMQGYTWLNVSSQLKLKANSFSAIDEAERLGLFISKQDTIDLQ